jgi:hypothetical protein
MSHTTHQQHDPKTLCGSTKVHSQQSMDKPATQPVSAQLIHQVRAAHKGEHTAMHRAGVYSKDIACQGSDHTHQTTAQYMILWVPSRSLLTARKHACNWWMFLMGVR